MIPALVVLSVLCILTGLVIEWRKKENTDGFMLWINLQNFGWSLIPAKHIPDETDEFDWLDWYHYKQSVMTELIRSDF